MHDTSPARSHAVCRCRRAACPRKRVYTPPRAQREKEEGSWSWTFVSDQFLQARTRESAHAGVGPLLLSSNLLGKAKSETPPPQTPPAHRAARETSPEDLQLLAGAPKASSVAAQ